MSKIDKIKEKYPELNVSLFDVLCTIDNTKTKKYLEVYCKILDNIIRENGDVENGFMVSFLVKTLTKDDISVLNELDIFLENNENKLNKNNNIQSYHTIEQIVAENNRTKLENQLKALQKEITRHYSDDIFDIIEPLTFEASKKYGYGTKWCTTMNFSRFNSYVGEDKRLFYIINKVKNYKIASHSLNGVIEYWTETNKEKDVFDLVADGSLPIDIAKEVHKIVNTTKSQIMKKKIPLDIINHSRVSGNSRILLEIERYMDNTDPFS